jgi:hypothetical protein
MPWAAKHPGPWASVRQAGTMIRTTVLSPRLQVLLDERLDVALDSIDAGENVRTASSIRRVHAG